MSNWFMFSLSTLLLYGFWSFLPKIATTYMKPSSLMIYEAIGMIVVIIFILGFMNFKVETNATGITYGVIIGAVGMLGTLLFTYALASHGKVSVVVTMTALYPLIAILLAWLILKEPITSRQGVGIILAVSAVVCFAG